MAGQSLQQAPYSFLEDLHSPNLHSQPEELNEIAADPQANLSDSDPSSDSESEPEQDAIAKLNNESISNDNASSGLTVRAVRLDYLKVNRA